MSYLMNREERGKMLCLGFDVSAKFKFLPFKN